ncbi:MAG: hypothetical protein KGH89_05385 [Thaumarchaeota archaeon]|nr:hypothetical protein [Nitrososphaerota archaeon]MDE1866240.1 hypothetical protein [Nitrososphaerota archaeon]
MEKSHGKKMQKDLDIMESRLNALDASSSDKYQKSLISVLKGIVENQKHLVDEFEHLKKAIDLLTLHIFKVEQSSNSRS